MIGENPNFRNVNKGGTVSSRLSFLYSNITKRISRDIITHMKNNNMSKNDLGVQMSISSEMVEEWLSGKHNFTLKELIKIQDALEINFLNIKSE